MACCIVILLWAQGEFRYDGFHNNIDNLYRAYQIQQYSGEKTLTTDNLPGPLAEVMRNEFPEIDLISINGGNSSAGHSGWHDHFKTRRYTKDF